MSQATIIMLLLTVLTVGDHRPRPAGEQPPTSSLVQGTSVNGYAANGSTVVVNFSTYPDEEVVQWLVCWKRGRLNPVPACTNDEHQQTIAGNNANSGSHTISGLTADRWYTVKVRAQYRKKNGNAQIFWRYVGKVQVKTP